MDKKPQDSDIQPSTVYLQWAEAATMLARIFEKEVDGDYLALIRETAPDLIRWAAGHEQQDLVKAAAYLSEFVKQIPAHGNQEAVIEDLAVEFASLFYGVGENPVNVHESVYLGDEHILYEAQYFEVVEFYQHWGYEKRQHFNEPEDHVANELDFLGFMLSGAAWALEKGDPEECQRRLAAVKAFAAEHLGRWGDDFCRSMQKASAYPLYLGAAYLTSGLLELIAEEDL